MTLPDPASSEPAGRGRNPLDPNERNGRPVLLDGGLATALEARGFDLSDELWSARILLDAPSAVRSVHRAYLDAGADCIATVSYQASLAGFLRRGLSRREGEDRLRAAARIALDARDDWIREDAGRSGRLRPLVAASLGPWGAAQADGSEYTGEYAADREELRTFHLERWRVFDDTDVDLFGCETIPSAAEVHVLLDLLRETPGRWAWISLSCRDESHLADGTPLKEVARACDAVGNVAAVGVNCLAPAMATVAVGELQRWTDKPVLVYPNSGEIWDAQGRCWRPGPPGGEPRDFASRWLESGVAGLGGCCRVGPEEIRELRRILDTEAQ